MLFSFHVFTNLTEQFVKQFNQDNLSSDSLCGGSAPDWKRSLVRGITNVILNFLSSMRTNVDERIGKVDFYVRLAHTMTTFRKNRDPTDGSHAILFSSMDSKRWGDQFKHDRWEVNYLTIEYNPDAIVAPPPALGQDNNAEIAEFLATVENSFNNKSECQADKISPFKIVCLKFCLHAQKFGAPGQFLDPGNFHSKKESFEVPGRFSLSDFFFTEASYKQYITNILRACDYLATGQTKRKVSTHDKIKQHVTYNERKWGADNATIFKYEDSEETAMDQVLERNVFKNSVKFAVARKTYTLKFMDAYFVEYQKYRQAIIDAFLADPVEARRKYSSKKRPADEMEP